MMGFIMLLGRLPFKQNVIDAHIWVILQRNHLQRTSPLGHQKVVHIHVIVNKRKVLLEISFNAREQFVCHVPRVTRGKLDRLVVT